MPQNTTYTTFISTRDDNALGVSFTEAMLSPSAANGGLYTFKALPLLSMRDISHLMQLSYTDLCVALFKWLGLGLDEAMLREALRTYSHFDNPTNPAPLTQIHKDCFMLNCFSGPTRAFKDMALQPFGSLFSQCALRQKRHYMILTATSGDTGPATLESFANKPYISVICLYPNGGTSEVQRLQMVTQNAQNCKVLGIRGNFDDAQNAIKALLNNVDFKSYLQTLSITLSAANSVNIGRIVFQMVYYFWMYGTLVQKQHINMGEKVSVVVPSGNFGNILGAFFAKKMGLPLDRLVVASNVNNILSDFIRTGVYDVASRTLIQSKSPAMDILKSSNVERVLYALFGAEMTSQYMQSLHSQGIYRLNQAQLHLLQKDFSAIFCDDAKCLEYIAKAAKNGFLLDPHSAIAYFAMQNMQESGEIGKSVFISTAEWSKFAPSVWEALAQGGIVNGAFSSEEMAIKNICEATKSPKPMRIIELFSKPIVQRDIIDIQDIESCIKQWQK